MATRLRLGRIAGLAIALDWSVVLIFALVVTNLALAALPAWHPGWSPAVVWPLAIVAGVLFLASILAHELAHALVARAFGTPVRSIVLFLFGGVTGIEREPSTPRAELLMAIVGPATSIVIGVGSSAAAAALTPGGGAGLARVTDMGPLATLLAWLGVINLVLGVFNLVPGFPLDGGRVVRAILWRATGDLARATRLAANGGRFIGWLLIAAGVLAFLGVRVPLVGPGFGALWLALIGWFLLSAARATYRDVTTREILRGVPVSRLAHPPGTTVDADADLLSLTTEDLLAGRQHVVAVVHDGALVGLVGVDDVRRVPPDERARKRAGDVMVPASRLPVLTPDDDCYEALAAMSHRGLDAVPVVQHGVLTGILSRNDVARWLALHDTGSARRGARGAFRRRPPEGRPPPPGS